MNRTAFPQSLVLLSIVRLAIVNGLMLWGLLWSAHDYGWLDAYWSIGVLFLGLALTVLHLARVNPDLIAARRRFGAGTRPWDYAMIAALVVGTTVLLWVAGFDRRWMWAQLPLWAELLGLLLIIAGVTVIAWAQAVNRHFEPSVRIQADRGHSVVDGGPYAHVRHPGYAGGALILVGMALALGSGWALLPALLVIALIVVRTVLEERALRDGLAGYADYTQRVKYRWVPWVW